MTALDHQALPRLKPSQARETLLPRQVEAMPYLPSLDHPVIRAEKMTCLTWANIRTLRAVRRTLVPNMAVLGLAKPNLFISLVKVVPGERKRLPALKGMAIENRLEMLH
jgi:hypothetical protein